MAKQKFVSGVCECITCGLICFIMSFASVAPAQADLEAVPGTRIRMNKPDGFERAATFSGFQNADKGAAIMITEIPAPYRLAISGFNEQRMAAKGMKLLSMVEQKVADYEGQLLELRQASQGVQFHKWILVFGNASFAQVITGSFPAAHAKELSEKIKQAILSSSFDESATKPSEQKDLAFELTGVEGLKFAGRIQNALLFNPSGELPKQKLEHTPCSFVVAQSISIGKLRVDDESTFSRERLKQSPELKLIEILSEASVKIAGLPGKEILASAKSKSDEDLFVYQVMLFTQDGYYIMRGDCLRSQRAVFEPLFRSMSKTFKLKSA
ncbi:MAG: hypothetical protein K2X27_08165 [Candidatus Obscuribacterales bacterium]|nr:hypothetical protein [Candidatus Obscuribacterales bacterium]